MTTQTNKTNDDGSPEGFDINLGRAQGDGWIEKEPGTVVHGRLLGQFEIPGQNKGELQKIYQVKLFSPCKASVGKGEENKTINLEIGQILNVHETKAIEDLSTKCGDGGTYDVWFKYVDQNPKTKFWSVIGPKVKVVKAPPPIPF